MQKVKKQTKKKHTSKGKLPSTLVELRKRFEAAFGKNSKIQPAN